MVLYSEVPPIQGQNGYEQSNYPDLYGQKFYWHEQKPMNQTSSQQRNGYAPSAPPAENPEFTKVSGQKGARAMRVVTGTVLAILAGMAAYHLLESGCHRLDLGGTTFREWTGYFYIYMGSAYAVIAAADALYAGTSLFCGGNLYREVSKIFSFTENEYLDVVALNALGPIVFVPPALKSALEATLRKKNNKQRINISIS